MSFLKFIVKADAECNQAWLHDVESAYHHASPQEKAFFLMDQSVMCNYLMRLYGEDGLPVLLSHYKNTLISWFLPDLAKLYTNVEKSERDPMVHLAYNNVCILLGTTPGKLDASECIKVLSAKLDVPVASDASFYAPYVQFVERTFGLYTELEQVAANRSFKVSEPATIPSFKIIGRHLTVRYEVLFPSYNFDYKSAGQFHKEHIPVDSILSYWSGYNWTGRTFSGVIGVLAAQCLERDTNAIPKGSKMLGYLEIYNKLFNGTGISDSLALSSDTTIQRRHLTAFISYLRSRYNVIIDDPKLLGRFISGTPGDDSKKLQDYLVTESPSDVSVEMYNAFKKSRFGTFSELDFVYNGRTGRENQTGYLNAKDPKKEDDPDAKQDTPESTEDPKEEPKKKEEPKEAENALPEPPSLDEGKPEDTAPENSGTNTDDDATNAEPNTGNQDSPAEDNSASGTTDAETTPDEEPNSDTSSTDGSGGNDTHTHNTQKLPPVPKLDDKRGVKLSLSEGESTNTVLYRKELGAYIDSLLANPPSSLSVQAISTLKIIRSSWLNMLSVTELYDFLRALVKLPKSITIKK